MQELPAAPAPLKKEGIPWVANPQLVCPRCQVRGYVLTVKVLWDTFARCQNCKSPRWKLPK